MIRKSQHVLSIRDPSYRVWTTLNQVRLHDAVPVKEDEHLRDDELTCRCVRREGRRGTGDPGPPAARGGDSGGDGGVDAEKVMLRIDVHEEVNCLTFCVSPRIIWEKHNIR